MGTTRGKGMNLLNQQKCGLNGEGGLRNALGYPGGRGRGYCRRTAIKSSQPSAKVSRVMNGKERFFLSLEDVIHRCRQGMPVDGRKSVGKEENGRVPYPQSARRKRIGGDVGGEGAWTWR